MAIYQLDKLTPAVPASAWVADNAQVIGDVRLGEDCSVWFGVVIRGDTETITVGRGTNVQDNSVLHADMGVPLTLGEDVTVGHQVMLHGCTIGDGSLIGIQAVVLNHAKIGKNCLVGAGSVVTEGKEFPDGSLIIGSPAKAVRQLSPEQIEGLKTIAKHYIENAGLIRPGSRRSPETQNDPTKQVHTERWRQCSHPSQGAQCPNCINSSLTGCLCAACSCA
ncbi:gamma carbonic anhydrase family protein [Polaromonas sp. Pch-P]|uniref:gamma carbonic anhydrase family protein n=1 Tax=Polaromonas sp. Pch-P TaxID=2082385 RepID=UPI00129D428F|nr:gamma carbonic anhydrase family protein [Polaromonas sp. Pch-P]